MDMDFPAAVTYRADVDSDRREWQYKVCAGGSRRRRDGTPDRPAAALMEVRLQVIALPGDAPRCG
jgi:hypothetical protein